MPDSRPSPGGQGDSPDDVVGGALSRSDLSLIRQALRNDWPIPGDRRERILGFLLDYVDPESEQCQTATDRTILSAHRALAAYAGLNLGQASLDLAREKHEGKRAGKPLPEIVREAQELARQRLRERDSTNGRKQD